MMIPAAEKLKDVLRQAELKMPEITVYADVTADDIMKDYDGGDLKDYLVEIMAKQAMSGLLGGDHQKIRGRRRKSYH